MLQVDALQLLALRRKQSGRQAGGADEGQQLALDAACLQLAAQLPQPDRAVETLRQLLAVRDNHAFSVMQAALAPGVTQEVRPDDEAAACRMRSLFVRVSVTCWPALGQGGHLEVPSAQCEDEVCACCSLSCRHTTRPGLMRWPVLAPAVQQQKR